MAEEETGFTFVDKRRTAVPETITAPDPEKHSAAEPAMTAEPAETEAVPETFSGSRDEVEDASLEDRTAPTTYDLLGYCINLLASQAWQKLGLLADPQTGEAKPDLAEAKVAIDAVGDLAGRLDSAPDTTIPADLRRDLKTLVNDLRLNYVSQRGPAA